MALDVVSVAQPEPKIGIGPRSVELFSGAGGLAIGTHAAGFHHELLAEWDEHACDTLVDNAKARALPRIDEWIDCVRPGDVRNIDFTSFAGLDFLAGGPPCQPFSIGGQHRGQTDPRDMIPEFIRAVRESRPRAFMLENVRGLTRPAFSTYFEYVRLQLRQPSVVRRATESEDGHRKHLAKMLTLEPPEYHISWALVNAADYGVPQVRWRVVVVGLRADEFSAAFEFPAPTHSRDALWIDQWLTGDYWRRHGLRPPLLGRHVAKTLKALERTEQPMTAKAWRTVRDAIGHLPPPTLKGSADLLNHWLQPGARAYRGHSGSPHDAPAKTLKAGVHGVPGGENMLLCDDGTVRYFTVHETALLQTFPSRWRFSGPWGETMRQLGNAVPVELARAIAGEICSVLLAPKRVGKTSER